MASPRRFGEAWDWQQIADLGEGLSGASSLKVQQDRIAAMAGGLLNANANVWFDESMFRLPDRPAKRVFPVRPPLEGMRRAVGTRRLVKGTKPRGTGKAATFAALPLEDQGYVLGALQVTRPRGPRFDQAELDLLESLARIVSVGLFASHRGEVERFRLRQLNLVRDVSSQIASVLDLDELARRVTALIQKTFRYYYVAIFTHEDGVAALRFRASAVAAHGRRTSSPIALEVELGTGLIGHAARDGVQIICNDVRAEPRYRFIDSLPDTRSEAVIPLMSDQRVLGVLDVQSRQLRGFHPNDVLVLTALADNVARAIEGARLYGDVRRRAEQLSLVADVSKTVTSTLDLTSMMSETAVLIHERFRFPHVALFTVHPRRRLIRFEAGSGRRAASARGSTISLDDAAGIIPSAARSGETVMVADVTQDPRYVPSPFPPANTRSELAVPLKFGEQVVGLLDVQSSRTNAFNDEDRLMFEAVAGTIAAAIRNADLFHSEQWRRQVVDSLREVAGLLSAHAGVEEVLEAILVQLERTLPVDVAAIWLASEDGLALSAIHGQDPALVEQARLSMPAAAEALATALTSDAPVIRMPGDPILPVGLASGYTETYSALLAPMRLGSRTLGLISLSHRSPGRFGHEAQAVTATFASYAAVAIENARLFDAAQEQAYASAALLQVAHAVVSPGTLGEILGAIVRILPILVGIRRAVLYLWDGEHEAFRPANGFGLSDADRAALMSQPFLVGGFPLLDAAAAGQESALHPLTTRATPKSWLKIQPQAAAVEEPRLPSVRESARLLISTPLSIKNDLFGVLLLEEGEGAHRFRQRRLEIINGIAQQIALAIQNDRLQNEMVVRERLETEVQLARDIQQAFAPDSLPEYPGWQLATRWRMARQVGGDFYDVLELGNSRLGLFIADVADKGMPAALFMALTRTLVRAAVLETESPAEALKRVNDLLYPDTRHGMFVTGVLAALELDTGRFTYANAGHNPPLWIRGPGGIERLGRTGVALGAVESARIGERSIILQPGETVLLFTDGLTEAASSNDDFFGEARLLEALAGWQADSAEGLLQMLEGRLDAFGGELPLADDLTMLALRRE